MKNNNDSQAVINVDWSLYGAPTGDVVEHVCARCKQKFSKHTSEVLFADTYVLKKIKADKLKDIKPFGKIRKTVIRLEWCSFNCAIKDRRELNDALFHGDDGE